jgi:hypothetical protein
MRFARPSMRLVGLVLLVLCALSPVACGQTTGTQHTAASAPAPTSGPATTGEVSEGPDLALIYDGKVAAEGGPEALAVVAKSLGMEVTFFDDPARLPSLLERATVCMIGGTEDDLSPLLHEFTPEIRRALGDWLNAGGAYLGICGGGYIASKGWEDNDDFVEALGIMPVSTEAWIEESAPMIITVTWNGDERPIYYQYGPVFLMGDESGFEILARYDDGRVAALATDVGRGRVVVCGPHPEAEATWLDDDPQPVDADTWLPTQDLAVELFQALGDS